MFTQTLRIDPIRVTARLTPRPGQGIPTDQGGPKEARRSLRVHSLRLLLNIVPILLVEL